MQMRGTAERGTVAKRAGPLAVGSGGVGMIRQRNGADDIELAIETEAQSLRGIGVISK
jgi:hypothetical protein